MVSFKAAADTSTGECAHDAVAGRYQLSVQPSAAFITAAGPIAWRAAELEVRRAVSANTLQPLCQAIGGDDNNARLLLALSSFFLSAVQGFSDLMDARFALVISTPQLRLQASLTVSVAVAALSNLPI